MSEGFGLQTAPARRRPRVGAGPPGMRRQAPARGQLLLFWRKRRLPKP